MKLHIELKPNARQSEITGYVGGVLQVKIAAPPVEGKANEALLRFLSKEWGIPRLEITLLKGSVSRYKTLEVPDGVEAQLKRHIKSSSSSSSLE